MQNSILFKTRVFFLNLYASKIEHNYINCCVYYVHIDKPMCHYTIKLLYLATDQSHGFDVNHNGFSPIFVILSS